MKINFIYATYSGTTSQMVDDALNILSKMNIVANKILLDESFQLSDLNHNDMLIFATPSWFDSGLDGQPHTSFISFMNKQFEEIGYTVWAAQEKSSGKLIGYIGLDPIKWNPPFGKAAEVLWRLG
jgi:flavodoxin